MSTPAHLHSSQAPRNREATRMQQERLAFLRCSTLACDCGGLRIERGFGVAHTSLIPRNPRPCLLKTPPPHTLVQNPPLRKSFHILCIHFHTVHCEHPTKYSELHLQSKHKYLCVPFSGAFLPPAYGPRPTSSILRYLSQECIEQYMISLLTLFFRSYLGPNTLSHASNYTMPSATVNGERPASAFFAVSLVPSSFK